VPSISIGTGGIQLHEADYDPITATMIKRVLWPETGTRAFLAFNHEYARGLARSVKSWLSLSAGDSSGDKTPRATPGLATEKTAAPRFSTSDKEKEGLRKWAILDPDRLVQFQGPGPFRAFRRSVDMAFRTKPRFARPNGAVQVTGTVVIEFQTARIKFEVWGWWDTQKNAVDKDSTVVVEKHIQEINRGK